MVALRGNETDLGPHLRDRMWARAALALTVMLGSSCSSGGGGATGDAGLPDASSGVDGAGELDGGDAASDTARGGTGGTVRGGAGGRGGTGGKGGTGGNPADAGADVAPSIPPPANDSCQTAQVIMLDRARMDVQATTRGANHDLALPCVAGGGDVFFSFKLSEHTLVYADTFGASFNTVLAFTDGCPGAGADGGAPSGPEPACVDDACGTKQSQAVALLPPGRHYLVVSGAEGESGDVTIHLEHAPVGAGAVAALGAGTSSASGTTSGGGRLALCEAGGPENSYWWTSCMGFNGGTFQAATCGTAYDTMLALQIPRTSAVVCNDDACKLQASITTNLPPGAGLHVLTVDGFTARQLGTYVLSTTRP